MAVASIHLVRTDALRTVGNLARIPLDRRSLRSSGATWWRVLGTSRDHRLGLSFHPGRRAVFAVWPDEAVFDRFVASHPAAQRWRESAGYWHAGLWLISGHGRWGGHEPLPDLATCAGWTGPVVTITRAVVRPGATVAFARHARAVTGTVDDVAGLRRVAGVGEAPLMRLGTLAVWDHDAAAVSASTAWEEHAVARRAAESDTWFSESMFARFAPFASAGAWGASDPVAVDQA